MTPTTPRTRRLERRPPQLVAAQSSQPASAAGGQPTARGLYSETFTPEEKARFALLNAGDLQAEIGMLRVAIRRTFQNACAGDDPDGDWLEVLDKLGLAAYRLAGLLRAQQNLAGDPVDEINAALTLALAQLHKEFKEEAENEPKTS